MKINDILCRLENNGYEAYIVGGYVRDSLLSINTSDVDICTNARVKDIMEIFNDLGGVSNDYGCVNIVTNSYNIDITTYRKDIYYGKNHKQVKIEYVDNLLEDIKRRDFTINCLCMNSNGDIIDLVEGKKDLENKVIRCLGDTYDKINDDPLRMLRAIRFATILDFKLDKDLYLIMKENSFLLKNISLDRVKQEISKILASKNALYGCKLMEELGFNLCLGIVPNKDICYVNDLCGMYSQIKFYCQYPFSKEEKDSISIIRKIVNKGHIDKEVIFDYGLYFCLIAADVLKINRDEVISLEKNSAIKEMKDIDIDVEEICDILNIKPGKIIKVILNDLKKKILEDNLDNTKEYIKNYLINNYRMWLDEQSNKKDF